MKEPYEPHTDVPVTTGMTAVGGSFPERALQEHAQRRERESRHERTETRNWIDSIDIVFFFIIKLPLYVIIHYNVTTKQLLSRSTSSR
jgi:hypothetical protein